jgi:hypothetical protein
MDAPEGPLKVELLQRGITVGPNTCGWVDGNFSSKQGLIFSKILVEQ